MILVYLSGLLCSEQSSDGVKSEPLSPVSNHSDSADSAISQVVINTCQNLFLPQRRCRSACTSVQSDQLLYDSLPSFLDSIVHLWTASSEFGTYRLCEQRRFRRACASAQSRQNLRCSLIQAMSQEEPSDRKTVPWPL